jgi:hypothetical protein
MQNANTIAEIVPGAANVYPINGRYLNFYPFSNILDEERLRYPKPSH